MTHYMIKPFKEFAFFSVFYDTLYPKIINYFTSFDRMFDSDVDLCVSESMRSLTMGVGGGKREAA